MHKRIVAASAVAIVIIAGAVLFPRISDWNERRQLIAEQESVEKPTPVKPTPASSSKAASLAPASSSLKAEVNWDVPFTPQAPTGNWDPPFNEACEEASVLMVLRYFHDEPIASPSDADSAIRALAAANEQLGFPIDDTAAQVVELINSQDSSLDVTLLENPTVDQLKKALSDEKLIIVPAQGQELGNPYFRQPGPPYHMLVLRGYTKDGHVITNDPGTKRGEEYVYTWDKLLSAVHDWNGGDVKNGRKVVIVIGD